MGVFSQLFGRVSTWVLQLMLPHSAVWESQCMGALSVSHSNSGESACGQWVFSASCLEESDSVYSSLLVV